MQDNKVKWWGMRANKQERKQINNLAKRLGVKESEAVRRAVAYLLAEKSVKTVSKVRR
ncbi:MAG: hypothetical protein MOGMAGMI_02010 [Candidatus Omnitrophica bacterium]|nr:hypothetical protein [Candidatus Omnitrophota bacterium]